MVPSQGNGTLRFIRGLKAHGSSLDDTELLTRVARGDELAFEALVRRHGPLVLAACRRILANDADADDAFQATFLLLARKAASVRNPAAVGCWLHGTAGWVARKARAARAWRRAVEARGRRLSPSPEDGPELRDLRAVLDEELGRLPAKYRDPLILCYLQGLTSQAAADRLGWPVGTLWGRLARARLMLRQRLVRRGLTLTAAGLTSALVEEQAGAAVAAELVSTTVALAAGRLHGPALALTQEALRAMFLTKLRALAAAACLAVAVCVAGVATIPGPAPVVSAAPAPSEAPAKKGAAAEKKLPPFDGVLVTRGQKAQPGGGKVILYSRNRYGNYPVATYDFTLGLRGDDEQVANYVDLVYGNCMREGAFAGKAVDGVPGAFSRWRNAGAAGAAGMDARTPALDTFRVGLYGGPWHRIVDCGKVDFARATVPPKLAELPGPGDRRLDTVAVAVGHVYVLHLYDDNAATSQDRYVKVRVLRHRDNDAVEIEWAPMAMPKRKG
jgi:RNA polymerase sigma factor (sigma-70 family)